MRIFISFCCLIFLLGCQPNKDNNSNSNTTKYPFKKEGNLSIFTSKSDSLSFNIEVAETEEETTMGLMYRQTMNDNEAMLFIFPYQRQLSFWMKNTYIPLDLLFINSNMKIVHIHKNAIPLDETMLPSENEAQYVLEINGGLADKLGIKLNQTISYNLLKTQ